MASRCLCASLLCASSLGASLAMRDALVQHVARIAPFDVATASSRSERSHRAQRFERFVAALGATDATALLRHALGAALRDDGARRGGGGPGGRRAQGAGGAEGATVSAAVSAASPATTPASWVQAVESYPDWDAALMERIAWCESRDEPGAVDPVAYDGAHATGLFQLLVFGPGGSVAGGSTTPMVNVAQAHQKWLAQGYGAWSASSSCWGG